MGSRARGLLIDWYYNMEPINEPETVLSLSRVIYSIFICGNKKEQLIKSCSFMLPNLRRRSGEFHG